MQLQHSARTGSNVVPQMRVAKPFVNSLLAVEIRAGDKDRLPPDPVIRDYNERSRKRPQKDTRLPCYIDVDDEPPPGWRPTERPPAPDADRGIWEYQF